VRLGYAFAHRVLPNLILDQWPSVRPRFQEGSAGAWLSTLWSRLVTADDPTTPAAPIQVTTVELGSGQGFLVEFAPVEAPGDASLALIPDLVPSTRYFTLELSPDIGYGQHWALGEWQDGGRHYYYGRVTSDERAFSRDMEILNDAMIHRVHEILGPGG
jgi:hypothetical protein